MSRSIVLLFLAVVLATTPVAADDTVSSEDRAAAQVLFDEGRDLADADDWKGACKKFQESMRIHEATGTQLNLARCYEKIGKLASAWINWLEAYQRAKGAGQDKRAKIAKERADALDGRISFITVRVQEPVDGLVVKRDGVKLGSAQWDTKLPIDGGTHRIRATADGYRKWQQKVKIKKEGSHVVVRVPRLEKLEEQPPAQKPGPSPDPEPPLDDPSDASEGGGVNGQIVAGIVFSALAAVGAGLGIGFGVAAMNANDDSLTHCPDRPDRCTRDGVDLRVNAFTFSYISTSGFIGAGAAAVTAIVLFATAPGDAPERTGLRVVPVPHGVGLGGSF